MSDEAGTLQQDRARRRYGRQQHHALRRHRDAVCHGPAHEYDGAIRHTRRQHRAAWDVVGGYPQAQHGFLSRTRVADSCNIKPSEL